MLMLSLLRFLPSFNQILLILSRSIHKIYLIEKSIPDKIYLII